MKPSNNFWNSDISYINCFGGSAVINTALTNQALISQNGGKENLRIQQIIFDCRTQPPHDIANLLEMEVEELLNTDDFIAAVLPPDKESLDKAEQSGKLCYMSADWYLDPKSARDNIGASADPRIGCTLALLNGPTLHRKLEQRIQNARDHDQQNTLILEGMNVNSVSSRQVIRMICSSVGATGNGSSYWFLKHGARLCAEREGVQAKIILNCILRGDLPVNDRERADLNELSLLKYLRAIATGKDVDPQSGKVMPCLYDQLILASNQNCNGIIGNLNQLLIHQGHVDYLFWHTLLGRNLRERLSDVENIEFDEYGDPQVALTASCAYISRNRRRLEDYCSFEASTLFAEALLTEGDTAQNRKKAVGLARMYEIVESEEENQVTSPIMRPADMGGENVLSRIRANFSDRVGNHNGMQEAQARAEALISMRNGDIPETFEPMMAEQAAQKCRSILKGLNKELAQNMRSLYGLSQSQYVFLFLKQIATNSQEIIMGKIHDLQALMQPHEDIITDALESLQRHQERSWIGRRFHPFLAGQIAESLETSGQIVLDCQLQIAACTIAVRDLLTPLIEYLDRKLSWLSLLAQNLQEIKGACRQKVRKVVSKPTTFHVPLGFELTTEEYLQDWFRESVINKGGAEQIVADTLARCLSRHDSLAFLAESNTDEIEDMFTGIAKDIFTPLVNQQDVVAEFQRIYPDKNSQRRIMQQCINQSEGRVLTTGEIDKPVVWLKYLSVPSSQHVSWIRDIFESVDKKPGRWEVSVHPDPDKISIFQLRNAISLTPIINRLEPKGPGAWAKIISRAPDPVSALMVGPNPADRSLKRVLAKAIVTNLLEYDNTAGFSLKTSEEIFPLGQEPKSVRNFLRQHWPEVVFIESTFGHRLVVAESDLTVGLRELKEQLEKDDPPSDPRLNLIDRKAIQETTKQLELLLPWARRMHKAINGEASE